jgi:hypothetical protein
VSRHWLEDALRATGLQSGSRFPRDLMSDVVMQLPLSVEGLPSLSAHAVRKWLRERGVQHSVSDADRALHGCLVARAGHGVVFLDADDEETERRFTLAHEIAHFILDHLLPRLRALKVFGDGILPVLDGTRPPTREEMLSAVLERVHLDVQVHLMSRGPGGAVCAWGVEESEQRADSLALELLAPARRATARLQRLLGENEDVSALEERAAEDLAEQYGLPRDVASSYVRLLLRNRRRRLSLSEEIFGSK